MYGRTSSIEGSFHRLSLNLTNEYVATNTKHDLDIIKKLHFIFLTILGQYNSIVEDSFKEISLPMF